MTTVGQIGAYWIVTGHFAMVRIVSAMGAADLLSRAQDRAVDVDRQGASAQQVDRMGNNVGVEGFQRIQALVGKPSQKRAHAAVSGEITLKNIDLLTAQLHNYCPDNTS